MDVGSLTQTANGRIQAMGASDAGGQITLRAQNVVDLRQGSVIDASGHVIGLVNPALIRIEGALVNVEGVVRANGVQWNNLGSSGGAIRLVANGGAASALDGLTTASGFSSGENRPASAHNATGNASKRRYCGGGAGNARSQRVFRPRNSSRTRRRRRRRDPAGGG